MKISPLIVALDVDRITDVEKIVARLGDQVSFYKVGLKLFIHYGPDILKLLKRKKKQIFLDLKLHDIPNTVAEACREAVRHQVAMLTLHAAGGAEMMRSARRAVDEEVRKHIKQAPWLMGVTVLTSMASLEEIGVKKSVGEQVLALAALASSSKLDGVICSPHEIASLRGKFGRKLKIVTPGVRPVGSATHDQKRVMTPREAYIYGADALVVGRPILEAKDPREVVWEILSARVRHS